MKIEELLRRLLVLLIGIISLPINFIAFGIVLLRILYYIAKEEELVEEEALLAWNNWAKKRDDKFVTYIQTGRIIF